VNWRTVNVSGDSENCTSSEPAWKLLGGLFPPCVGRRVAAAGIRSSAPSQRRAGAPSQRPGHRHQVIAIPSINAAAIEHQLELLIRLIGRWHANGRGGCSELPAGTAQSNYCLRISARSGLLDSALPASLARSSSLVVKRLNQLLELGRQLAESWHHSGLPAISCRRAAGQSGACSSSQKVRAPTKAAIGSCANVNYST
jgi:hypothetical protein